VSFKRSNYHSGASRHFNRYPALTQHTQFNTLTNKVKSLKK